MKTLTISILASAMAFGYGTHVSAQEHVDVSVTQPCHLAWKDIPVTHGHEMNGVPVYVTTLKKTDTRKTFADLTPKELKRLKKKASRLQASPDPEKEASMNGYIQIYITVPTRPCPECPQPTTTSKS